MTLAQLGGYEVLAPIARGGMGEIVVARAPARLSDHPLVALKILDGGEAQRDSTVAMFMDEAQIMSQLAHPNVLRILDFGKDDGTYFMAMEYLQGRTLAQLMTAAREKAEGLEASMIAAVGAAAAEGLHAAHVALGRNGAPLGIVHRDVSPANIFVTYDGRTKVIDFGIARAAHRFTRTTAGVFKGKAAYMSPEQVQERPVDGKTDVFALGICLWEMRTGKRLFARPDQFTTMQAVVADAIAAPHESCGAPETPLDTVIMHALERDPRTRISADRMAKALTDASTGCSTRDISEQIQRLFPTELAQDRALLQKLRRSLGQADIYATAPVRRSEAIQEAVASLGNELAPLEERQRQEREVLSQAAPPPRDPKALALQAVVGVGVLLALAALVLFFLR